MKIRIGTRSSKLALAQTKQLADALQEKAPAAEIEVVHISTAGDRLVGRPLSEIGGRGVFVKEIERALTAGEIDVAVHSAKDLPLKLCDGLEIAAVLPRANPCDCLVTREGEYFGADAEFVIGTGSVRRTSAFGRIFPHAVFRDIRGNVDTRLQKLADGAYDAVILAQAGLERLHMDADGRFSYQIFDISEILCAPCQGIIAAQCRSGTAIAALLQGISDEKTYRCFETERYVLERLGAGCTMPIGAYASAEDGSLRLSVTGDGIHRYSGIAPVDARFSLAEELIARL